MKPSRLAISCLFALAVLSACAAPMPPQTDPTALPPTLIIRSEPSSTPLSLTPLSPIPASPTLLPPTPFPPTPLPPAPRPHYSLSASLNYDQHRLTVEETISYTNPSTDPLNELLLMVEPTYVPGVFKLNSLSWEDGTPVAGLTWETGFVHFPLRQPLFPRQSLGLALSYELYIPVPVQTPDSRPVVFGYTARQTNLVDWYPFVPPYVAGIGWLADPAHYFGEHLTYEAADFDVSIRLEDARTDLVIAASAADQFDGQVHRYHLEAARSFAWSVSHEYKVTTTTVGDVTVLGYSFPFDQTAGQAALDTTAKALALYSQLYAPYPHKTLSVVEADFLDGMEYDGLFFLSKGFYNLYRGTPGEYLVAIAAHETAHQWWFGLVGNDQATEPWLDEALSTYSERLFYERVYPEALDWWWTYRVNYYNPSGKVGGSIYSFSSSATPYRSYRDAVYLNGAVFLEELRQQIGEAAFFAFLQDYAAQYTHKVATGPDFFNLLRRHTSIDLGTLISKYFSTNY
jgi:hypothetical protein